MPFTSRPAAEEEREPGRARISPAPPTVIRLERWPDFPEGPCWQWAAVGCAVEEPVAGVVIEHLTVDANWSGLPNRPASAEPHAALHGIACFHHGPLAHRDLRVSSFYGKHAAAVFAYAVPLRGSPSRPALTIERLTVLDVRGDWPEPVAAPGE